nr:uncharacterized protein LOC119159499 isoform X2 [Rhipicephalus microplus]
MLDSCGGYRDETDDAVARATEDVVMEGRLLDSPDSDVCAPGRGVAAGMYGAPPPPPEEERAAVEGCCSEARHSTEATVSAALLEGAGSDMDTIPEEETGSELLTESSQLDSDRSEPEDSSESPLPRDTPEEGSEEENKSDWALPSTVGQVDDLAPTSGDEEILSPIEHAPSPFREREEKSRTPDSEDPMSSDEGGGLPVSAAAAAAARRPRVPDRLQRAVIAQGAATTVRRFRRSQLPGRRAAAQEAHARLRGLRHLLGRPAVLAFRFRRGRKDEGFRDQVAQGVLQSPG